MKQAATILLAAALVGLMLFLVLTSSPPASVSEPTTTTTAWLVGTTLPVISLDPPGPVPPPPPRATNRVADDVVGIKVTARGSIPDDYMVAFETMNQRITFAQRARTLGMEVLDELEQINALRIRARDEAALARLLEQMRPDKVSRNYQARPPLPVAAPEGAEYRPFAENALSWLGVGDEHGNWGKGTMVAILDTGVGEHPALLGADVVRVDLVGEGTPVHGHATSVASLMVGQGEGVDGLAPAVDVLSIRVVPTDGVGDAFTLAKGIILAADRGADVLNICLGTYGDTFVLREAVAYAQKRGAVVVAAAGNDAQGEVVFPARYEGVVGVAGVDSRTRHLYFSNRGPEVDIAAPGWQVAAAGEDKAVIGFSGTSAAVPFVSGAIAAMLSETENLSPAAAAALVLAYTRDGEAPGPDPALGAGVLDMGRLQERDRKGIFDIAAAGPYLSRPDGTTNSAVRDVVVYAQNVGTEPLPSVVFGVLLAGKQTVLNFQNVGVGATVSHRLRIGVDAWAGVSQMELQWWAETPGVQDAQPHDNVRRIVLAAPTAGKVP